MNLKFAFAIPFVLIALLSCAPVWAGERSNEAQKLRVELSDLRIQEEFAQKLLEMARSNYRYYDSPDVKYYCDFNGNKHVCAIATAARAEWSSKAVTEEGRLRSIRASIRQVESRLRALER